MRPRLKAVCLRLDGLRERLDRAGKLDDNYLVVDVGCDHGYVAKYVFERGLADRVVASDISAGSLNKARLNLADTDVQCLLGDGLSVIEECVGTAVIAGMGGLEIIRILSEADYLPVSLVLVPHRNARELREYLVKHYTITYDEIICDKGKYYSVIECVISPYEGERSGELFPDDILLEFGVTSLLDPSEAFKTMLEKERAELDALNELEMSPQRYDRLCRIIEVQRWLGLRK